MKYYLELRFFREDGKTIAAISEEIHAVEGRKMQDIETPTEAGIIGSTMDAVVSILKVKEFRRGLFDDACRRMGLRLANYMEDREGWHGVSRQESVQKMEQTI